MLGYEVLGAERRRRWSLSEKRRIIFEAFSAAEGVSSVARRHSIYPQQIYRWRRDLGDCDIAPKVRFLPVSIAIAADTEAALSTVASARVEIGCLAPLEQLNLQAVVIIFKFQLISVAWHYGVAFRGVFLAEADLSLEDR